MNKNRASLMTNHCASLMANHRASLMTNHRASLMTNHRASLTPGDVAVGVLIGLLDMVNSALFNLENLQNLRDRAFDLLLVISENAAALMGRPGKYEWVVRKFEDLLHVSAPSSLDGCMQFIGAGLFGGACFWENKCRLKATRWLEAVALRSERPFVIVLGPNI